MLEDFLLQFIGVIGRNKTLRSKTKRYWDLFDRSRINKLNKKEERVYGRFNQFDQMGDNKLCGASKNGTKQTFKAGKDKLR